MSNFNSMGVVHPKIRLSNPTRADLKPVDVTCIVDTGATYLCIPESIALQLQLKELQKRDVTLANGHKVEVPYVGSIKVEFENRLCFVGAMVMGEVALLGSIPMEDMDLIIHPNLRKLTVHPERPNIPGGLAM